MVPLVFVQNIVDATVSCLTVGEEFTYNDYSGLPLLFNMPDGSYEVSGKRFHVIHIESYVFCVEDVVNFDAADGKLHKIPISFSYAKKYSNQVAQLLYEQTQEIINHVHDIQYLVGALLHNSIVIEGKEYSKDRLYTKLRSINYVTGIMSAKSAYFQYLTEDIDAMKRYDVSVVNKTYKVHKTVEFLSKSLGKNMVSEFSTNPKDTKGFVNAPDILEFIPFQLVENAIKYGLVDGDIDIVVSDSLDHVLLEVQSMGPRIDDDEKERIFEKGYRGRHGEKYSEKGHGLGLFQTRKALKELVNGDIWVDQDKHSYMQISGIDFCNTKFVVRFAK